MGRKSEPFMTSMCAVVVVMVAAAEAVGGKVGGRMKIWDVKTNEEVQDLGRYSVEEYNRMRQWQSHYQNGIGVADLKFAEVVEAEKQVVSGMKYFLRISATTPGGVPRTFDAVVVVKPWEKSKELLNFAPSPSTK